MSKIPVFVSCPTDLNKEQEKKRKKIVSILSELDMDVRALGRSDYPKENPLKEVYVLANHCAGGIILGFEQTYVVSGRTKRGTSKEKYIDTPFSIPTPWNQIEAGILFSLKLPLLIYKEVGVTGGIFDIGSSNLFVHEFPEGDINDNKLNEIKQVISSWYGDVNKVYYNY